jgi:hypothetical protein
MIDYKYPTIASEATPISSGALVAHPMKNYFEKNEEENFESMDSTFTPIGSAYFKQSKIEEIEVWRSQRYVKSKIEEIEV